MSKKKPSPATTSGSSKKIIIYAIIGIIAVAAVSFSFLGRGADTTPDIDEVNEENRITSFRQTFCGEGTTPNANGYINEIALTDECEMPLGIALEDGKVWYISTKQGILGSYDPEGQAFEKFSIPVWNARSDPTRTSMSWEIKPDSNGDLWFTDQGNALWKFVKSTEEFQRFPVPARYPVDFEFDPQGNIYFVGIQSQAIFYGNVSEMKDETSDGISEISLPLEAFEGIDSDLITSGSIALDKERGDVWVSMLSFANGIGKIFKYSPSTQEVTSFDLPEGLSSPVGLDVDNSGDLFGTDHGTSKFFKIDRETGEVIAYTTSVASSAIYGGQTPDDAYTLPYWIEKGDDGAMWFNEHTGNKIAKFDPSSGTLVEYWIPSQNKFFATCPTDAESCGLSNALQFSASGGQIWFTEWTENKIGRLDIEKPLPFSVSTSESAITVQRGESKEIMVDVSGDSASQLTMLASGTFSSNGVISPDAGIFSQESITVDSGSTRSISYTFTAPSGLTTGTYTLMLGAGTNEASVLKSVTVNVV